MRSLFKTQRARQQRGFSLLEIMVGVAIGLIGIVVIFQVLLVWEERRRTTSSGSDAQVAGTLAMFALERDLKQAGYGFGMSGDIGCTVMTNMAPRGVFTFPLVPVVITPGAIGAPDSLKVLYGSSNLFTASQGYNVTTDTTKKGSSRGGFAINDQAVMAKDAAANCAMVKVTGYPTPDDGATLVHESVAATGAGVLNGSGAMLNLGANPQRNAWSIQGGRVLARADDLRTPTTWAEVSEGIIDLRAQYGYDDDDNKQIECPNAAAKCEWVSAPLAAPTPPISWLKVRAIRVALLARSQQYEKTEVTTALPTWSGGNFGAPTDPDWKHYRYRAYEQVIPLRNTIWGTAK